MKYINELRKYIKLLDNFYSHFCTLWACNPKPKTHSFSLGNALNCVNYYVMHASMCLNYLNKNKKKTTTNSYEYANMNAIQYADTHSPNTQSTLTLLAGILPY